MNANNLRRQLEALKARLQPRQSAVDWDALANDPEAFIASVVGTFGPLVPSPEEASRREHLTQLCADLGVTPAEVGLCLPQTTAPHCASGFVEITTPVTGEPS